MNIEKIVDEYLATKIYVSPHPLNRASEAAHPCELFLILSRTKNELRQMHDVVVQRIFEEGNFQEEAVLRTLRDAGLKIIEQQRAFDWKKCELSGHIDGMIAVDGQKIPLEIKSASPNSFYAIKSAGPMDLIHSKYYWQRRYPAQILLYMLMSNSERGVLLFKNKVNGELKQIDFQLNDETLAYCEEILKKLERVNASVKEILAGAEVPKPSHFMEECKTCPFRDTWCFPNRDYGPGYEIATDNQLTHKLNRWAELAPMVQEYEQLDREIKELVKGKNLVVGDFIIETKEFSRKSYDIPAEVKNKYAVETKYQIVKIQKIGERA